MPPPKKKLNKIKLLFSVGFIYNKILLFGGKVICNRWLDVILDCSNESGKIQFKKQGKQILPDAVIHMLRGECFKVLQCGFFFSAYGEMNTASVRFELEIG